MSNSRCSSVSRCVSRSSLGPRQRCQLLADVALLLPEDAQPRLFALVEIPVAAIAKRRRDARELRRAPFDGEQHAHRIEADLLHPRDSVATLGALPRQHRVYQAGEPVLLAAPIAPRSSAFAVCGLCGVASR